jgi:arylsulfatase A-like enzyme
MPLKKYLDRYDPRSIPVAKSFDERFENKPGLHRRESESWGQVTEEDFRQSRAHSYASVEPLDEWSPAHPLDETGQADNTLVVFTTDHGDTVGAHRMWIKGWIPYEECYRIPLIVRWPGRVQAGTRCDHLVQLQDLAHTYVQAAGARSLPYPDGRSLVQLLENPRRTDWSDDILCAYYGGEFLYTQRIAINRRWKYVFNGFDFDELYDLESDPDEMRNLAGASSHRAGRRHARALEPDNRRSVRRRKPRNSIGEPQSPLCARYWPLGSCAKVVSDQRRSPG